jgi:mRNA interferase RelE/StbE
MSYELAFLPIALTEWRKLDGSLRAIFKKKLTERLANPHVPQARLHHQKPRYKIKWRDAGYRLVYEVQDTCLTVLVVAVGKRQNDWVYEAASGR